MFAMRSSYHLFNAFGIPVKADPSLLLLLLYLLVVSGSFASGMTFAIILLTSIVLHELAHSLVAIAFGGKVRDITLQLLGGCAAISEMPRKAWQELLMALAGPGMSFLLAGVSFALMHVVRTQGLLNLLSSILVLNFVLGVFNLLPAFPMDGGRVLRAFLQMSMSKLRATWIASRIGRGVAIFMMITAFFSIINRPIIVPSGNGLGSYVLYILIAGGGWFRLFIGWMIYQAAEQEYQLARFEAGYGATRSTNPFDFFGGGPRSRQRQVPPDDDEVIISPPPYKQNERNRRSDMHRD